jgi:FkbM family methyltransferase
MQLSLRSKATDLALYQYGIYEVSGTKLVENVLRPGMTFIDVGANAGYYTLIAARLVGSAGHVYSFEPIKGIVERLRHNIELNGFRNVTIEEGALARCPGRASIYRSAVAENDGLASLLPGPARMPDPEQVVLTTLDEVSGRLPGRLVHLIKIDVEGTEGEVLAGGRETLARDSGPLLLFESFSVGAIAEELAHFGYDVRRVHYSLGGGLEFPRIDERFDDLYATYEPPEFVALKAAWQFGSFDEISYRSRRRIPKLLRILSSLA